MKTIAQQLNVKKFPFVVKDSKGKEIYYEDSNGFWWKSEFNAQGKEIYYENFRGYWWKKEYDAQGNQIYFENFFGYWSKREYDSQDNQIYFEDSYGEIIDKRPKKVILSMDEIVWFL